MSSPSQIGAQPLPVGRTGRTGLSKGCDVSPRRSPRQRTAAQASTGTNRDALAAESDRSQAATDDSSPRVLLITSNGAGMGHLTRMLAVALGSTDPNNCTILSMSVALPVVLGHGVRAEYCPSPTMDHGRFAGPHWHEYLAERIVALAREIDAEVIMFDGVAPYRGISMAGERMPDVALVWMRRGLWRPGANERQLASSVWFDLIIEPGDLGSAGDLGATAGRGDANVISPVSMLDVVTPLPRALARAELGLTGPTEQPTLLLTLGSGRLGDVQAPGQVILDTLAEYPDWHVAVTRASAATTHLDTQTSERVHELSGVYPLVTYLNAFDAVVSSAGYNATHEFVTAGLPTLLVPNPDTRTDDQIARAEQLHADGLALAARTDRPEQLAAAVRELLASTTRDALRAATEGLGTNHGAGGVFQANQALRDGLASFRLARIQGRPTREGVTRVPTATVRARRLARRILGRRGANLIRRVMGKNLEAAPLPAFPIDFVGRVEDLTAEPSAVTGRRTVMVGAGTEIPVDAIQGRPRVEHLIEGASAAYRQERLEIARRFHEYRQAW